MGSAFWVRRYLVVFAIAFTVIGASHLARGRSVDHAIGEALLWALISATVFTAGRLVQSRRGQHCSVCRDTPELSNHPGPQA